MLSNGARPTSTLELNLQQRALNTLEQTRKTIKAVRRAPKAYSRAVLAQTRRRVFSVTTALILIWLLVLYLGEVVVFSNKINACEWGSWEQWPADATPHHLAFIADPQLVDPHTYPGRPWPLSMLTMMHTDVYLRRAFSRVQITLDPHSVIFLGDLFDGGREWATRDSHSPEERYQSYGRLYWEQEYERFAHIFLKERGIKAEDRDSRNDGRRVLASLPGNHDLGFGRAIQLPVRDRFHAFFGESNRIDVIGNHTFVSLDTVSLSARDQRGSEDIWGPGFSMLAGLGDTKKDVVDQHLRHLFDEAPSPPLSHDTKLLDLLAPRHIDSIRLPGPPEYKQQTRTELPTVLLTHVPLSRPPNTDCGSLRERGTSIPIQSGYQYQNALSASLSDYIIEVVGADGTLQHAFSGDDHDYCEIVHDASISKADPTKSTGLAGLKIREITVKSISWAMGVRRPGFLLVSLWNPIGRDGRQVTHSSADQSTLQTHLCLLPDQLGILIRYGFLLGISLVALLARAIYTITCGGPTDQEDSGSLLPISLPKRKTEDYDYHVNPEHAGNSGGGYTGASTSSIGNGSASRKVTRTRSGSLRSGSLSGIGYNGSSPSDSFPPRESQWPQRGSSYRLNQYTAYTPNTTKKRDDDIDEEGGYGYDYRPRARRRNAIHGRTGCMGVLLEFRSGVWRVARVVLVAYMLLLLW